MSSVGAGASAAVVGTRRSTDGDLELLVRWRPGLAPAALPVEMATALLPAQTAAFLQATTFLAPVPPSVKTETPPVQTEAPNKSKETEKTTKSSKVTEKPVAVEKEVRVSHRRKAASPPVRSPPQKKARTEAPTAAQEAPKAAAVPSSVGRRKAKPCGSLAKAPKGGAASGRADGAGRAADDDSEADGKEDREEPSDDDDDDGDDDDDDDDEPENYEIDDEDDDYEDWSSEGEDSGSDGGQEDEAKKTSAAPKPPTTTSKVKAVMTACAGPGKVRGLSRTDIEHRIQRRFGEPASCRALRKALSNLLLTKALTVVPGGSPSQGPFLCGPPKRSLGNHHRLDRMVELLKGKPGGLSFDELSRGMLEQSKAEGAVEGGEKRTRHLILKAKDGALKKGFIRLGKGGTRAEGPFVLGPRRLKDNRGDLARRGMAAVDGRAGFTRHRLYDWARREAGWSMAIRISLQRSLRREQLKGRLRLVPGGEPKDGPFTLRP